ncbi:MAG: N-acetylneuraminate synthase [Kiloniellales bacterium]
MSRVTVIAEAGVNHNGDLDRALALVDAAAEAGADVVKFQTFRAEGVASRFADKADYQKQTTDAAQSQVEMLRALELDREAHKSVMARCESRGIEFLSTPFDLDSLAFLVDDLKLGRLKIGSGDLTNAPLLLALARGRVPAILSTGMATLEEIREALGVLAFGYLGGDAPSRAAFAAAYGSADGRRQLAKRVTLLHCTTEYPAPHGELNLKAMDAMVEAFGLPVGFSDHSLGTSAAVAAAGRGAVMVEKHLTLDRSLPGPDHRASLEPGELALMTAAIREVEAALGDGIKVPQPSEAKNKPIARKSLIAARPIKAGEPFTAENVTTKRPGSGLPPLLLWDLLGRTASRDYRADEPIAETLS